ncbi:MAG: class I SAM-dependent methyltransferase [Nitrospirae bacterium]|nr:class I SAM-dependent methyltransferase [Nitrospirota bacterium]
MKTGTGRELIRPGKYYDWSRSRPLSTADGCTYEDWKEDSCGGFAFAVHPDGFPVFLPYRRLCDSDEYSGGDPYEVEANMEGWFHTQRIDSTLYLLRAALDEGRTAPRILDIGCGQGHITAAIRERFPEAEISGLDSSLTAVRYAVKRFPGIDFCVADACDPPYSGEYFDVVVCNNVWEHVPAPLLMLKAAGRVLKSRGFLIVSTPSRYRFSNILRVLRGRRAVLMSPHHVTEYTVGQVVEQLRWGGFEVKRIHSKPLSVRAVTLKSMVAYRLILPAVRTYLRMVNSEHVLEDTAFFLARKEGSPVS